MKTKIDIVLELVRQGKVTNEEAKILLTTERIVEKEYIYSPTVTYSNPNEAVFTSALN